MPQLKEKKKYPKKNKTVRRKTEINIFFSQSVFYSEGMIVLQIDIQIFKLKCRSLSFWHSFSLP